MHERHRAIVDAIRNDTSSGATDILLRAVDLLLETAHEPGTLAELAGACARAQPSMAGLLTLEALVRGTSDVVPAIERFRERIRRAPAAIARHAAAILLLAPEPRPTGRPALRVVTCSSSRAVEAALHAVATEATLTVSCAESRPKREGVELARRLAGEGIAVELYSDAGVSAAVEGSDAVVVGADAVGPEFFVNKVGTAAICGLGQSLGVPVYVLAGREKVLGADEVASLRLVEGAGNWLIEPTRGVLARDPYFERVPLRLVSVVVTDGGARSAERFI